MFLISAVLVVASAFALACGDGGATSSPKTTATPVDATAIRRVDFTTDSTVTNLLRQLGSGEVSVRDILFADLTGDGASASAEDGAEPAPEGTVEGEFREV